MRSSFLFRTLCTTLIAAGAFLGAASIPVSTEERAISSDPEVAAAAIRELRAQGAAGLRQFARRYGRDLDLLRTTEPSTWTVSLRRLKAALERIAGQKDAETAGLFWYTDLSAALDEARRSKRPVVSLRMLGKLTDELSCANSRYFRTLLYSDPSISQELRSRFVLHWSTEREVPVMEVRFGNRRTLRTTFTGNSIHYFITPDGTVYDAIPGLVSPSQFLSDLQLARRRAAEVARAPRNDRRNAIVGTERPTPAAPVRDRFAGQGLAISKSFSEMGVARRAWKVTADDAKAVYADVVKLDRQVGAREPRAVIFAPETLALLRRKMHRGSVGPESEQARFDRIVEQLRRNIALDTEVNEQLLRARVRAILGSGLEDVGRFEELNRVVYNQVFQMPVEDPYAGVLDLAELAAIENGGFE